MAYVQVCTHTPSSLPFASIQAPPLHAPRAPVSRLSYAALTQRDCMCRGGRCAGRRRPGRTQVRPQSTPHHTTLSIPFFSHPTAPRFLSPLLSRPSVSAANGITTTVRSLGVSLGPTLAGYLLSDRRTMAVPWIIAGGLKIVYDLLLLRSFRAVQTDVEKKKAQAALAEAAAVVGAEGEATVGDAAIDAVEEGAEGASEVINPLVQQSPPT